MQTQAIIFPAHILRGAGTLLSLGEICGNIGQRALLIGDKALDAAVSALS
ncbi:hypothetical protein GCM10023078_02960 [Gibbsiella greigii]